MGPPLQTGGGPSHENDSYRYEPLSEPQVL